MVNPGSELTSYLAYHNHSSISESTACPRCLPDTFGRIALRLEDSDFRPILQHRLSGTTWRRRSMRGLNSEVLIYPEREANRSFIFLTVQLEAMRHEDRKVPSG